jgi:phytoene/squalene synthetase
MSTTTSEFSRITLTHAVSLPRDLSASITWEASKQTYFTIRLLVDKERVHDAYRAYGYFRWLDDRLDQVALDQSARIALVERQQALVERCYRGERPRYLADEEELLVRLIHGDLEERSGLQIYIRQMMAVMSFDARRRGQLVTAADLEQYTCSLATAVTEAMHHFIGHGTRSPQGDARYVAVTAAHITHMLRDTLEDAEAGYFNIPREIVESQGIDPRDVSSAPFRAWVRSQVQRAREYFAQGRTVLRQVESLRCRLAGFAYMARFESVLDAIEREGYQLRASYLERKSMPGVFRAGWFSLAQALRP